MNIELIKKAMLAINADRNTVNTLHVLCHTGSCEPDFRVYPFNYYDDKNFEYFAWHIANENDLGVMLVSDIVESYAYFTNENKLTFIEF